MNSFSSTLTRFGGLTGLFCILAALFVAGCKSMDKPAGASFASVVIINQTPDKIRQATIAVFESNGYQTAPPSDGSLVFEREATRREQIDYAGFAGAHEGEKVDMRVAVQIVPKDVSAYWLQCKAYAICNPGQTIFENSTPLFNFQSGPYQKLMNQVAEKVIQVTPTP